MAVEVKRGSKTEQVCAKCEEVIVVSESHMRAGGGSAGYKRYHMSCYQEMMAGDKAVESGPTEETNADDSASGVGSGDPMPADDAEESSDEETAADDEEDE